MVAIAVVDAGPLYASIDRGDDDHDISTWVLNRRDLTFVVPALVVTEVVYMISRRLGPMVEARFVVGLTELSVEAPYPEEWARIAEFIERYADLNLGTVDASVIVLAERYNTDLVVTLDQRHFRAVRPRHCTAFRLLPYDA